MDLVRIPAMIRDVLRVRCARFNTHLILVAMLVDPLWNRQIQVSEEPCACNVSSRIAFNQRHGGTSIGVHYWVICRRGGQQFR